LRARRNEKRVEEVVIAVQGLVTGHELEFELVGARPGHPGRHDDVTVDDGGCHVTPTHPHPPEPVSGLSEIEDKLLRNLEYQAGDHPSLHWPLPVSRDGEREVISQVPDGRRAFLRQHLGDATARSGRSRGRALGRKQCHRNHKAKHEWNDIRRVAGSNVL
jgi:hypothetical protein